MNDMIIDILRIFGWILSFILTLYAAHFLLVSLFSIGQKKQKQKFGPKHKFAAVIAARNEEMVVGNLVESLKQQDYPQELLDIIVIPNNCTDATRDVAEKAGAKIFECQRAIKSKGDVLREFFDHILAEENDYDGFCIFDADNIVDKNFVAEMNNELCRGAKIAQGYRDSKNPRDTIISSCYSIYYYIVNRFHNHARSVLNVSAMINGSGFMVSKQLMQEMGGWFTQTMTEDIEFTTKCVLRGEKVSWAPEAVIYDEQPLTFEQSWKQRKRWSTGLIQCMETYARPLLKDLIRKRNFSCFDLIMFFAAPFIQVLYAVSILLTVTLNVLYISYSYFPQTDLFYKLFMSADYSYFMCVLMALAVVVMERKHHMIKGIVSFWFFMITWLPINLVCLFKRQTEWTQIQHTRVIKIEEMIGK